MPMMQQLWQNAVAATENPELGLLAASIFQPSYLKGIGLAWMASESLEQGLKRFVENSHLINTAMQLTLVEDDDFLTIQYHPKSGQAPLLPPSKVHPCAIQLGVAFFIRMFKLASSKNIPASKVYFTFSPPENSIAYKKYFNCPIEGKHTFNGIQFSKSSLKKALPTFDPVLVELNELAIEKHLCAINDKPVSRNVSQLITHQLLTTEPLSEELISYKMHMSKRTLQRKLGEEGELFSNLLHRVRMSIATEQLSKSKRPITELALHLGYGSSSSFARAFKQHHNLTPLQYRQREN